MFSEQYVFGTCVVPRLAKTKVGDTLTATASAAVTKYEWTINDVFYADSESITVPATAREGDAITVTVTAEDGETASDTVYVVEDLALINVEAADNNQRMVLRAYFSEPIGDLQPGDIQIRKVSDNKLSTVESVIMSSDKMTATIALVGYSAGQNINPLLVNTDYRMIVTTAEGTAEKVFSIPGIADEEVVTGIDASKRTITSASGTFTDENELISDFQEVLGRTVTFEFNKNNVITDFHLLDEAVIYTAITAKDANGDAAKIIDTIVDTDKNEYSLVSGNPGTTGKVQAVGDIYATEEIVLDGNASVFENDTAIAATKQTAKYAKIVLNGNGSVRSLVTIYNWDKSVYVKEVKETYIIDYSGAYTNLKDFTILKGGVAVTIDDIEEDDVVFVSTDNSKKIAEVYNDNMISGELTVYTGKADIGSDRYDLGGGYAVIGTKVVADTTANLKDSSGADVVAYLDRANKLAQTIVDSVTAATSSEFVVLTEQAKNYTEGPEYMVSFKGGNGTEVSEYVLAVSDLTSLVTAAGVKKTYDKTKATPNGAAITNLTTGTFGINGTTDINMTDLTAGTLVKVIKNADGDIIGLELGTDGTADYDFYTAQDKDMKSTQTANDTFEGKMTSLNKATDALIEASTPVYVYNKTNKTVVLYDYEDVNFTGAATALKQIKARLSKDRKSVVAFYIDETKTNLAAAAIAETKRAVVADAPVLDKDGKNYAELTVYEGLDKVTYKTFAQDVAALTPALAKGDFVDVALTEDGEVYSVTAKASTAAALGEFVVETNHVDADYILNTETGVETTIVVKAADGSYSTKTWSELGALVGSASSITVATYGNSAFYVDAIYVELASAVATAGLTVTFPAFTGEVDTTAGFATIAATDGTPASLAAGLTSLTVTLEESTDGLAWTNNSGAAKAAAAAVTTTNDVNIKANTYYRLHFTKTGAADAFVNMTGSKTAAAAFGGATVGAVTEATATIGNAGATAAFALTAVVDQFGETFTTTDGDLTLTKDDGNTGKDVTGAISASTAGGCTITFTTTAADNVAGDKWTFTLGTKTGTFTIVAAASSDTLTFT